MIVNNREDFVRLHGQEAYEDVVVFPMNGDTSISQKDAILTGHYSLICDVMIARGYKNMSLLYARSENESEYDILIGKMYAKIRLRKEKKNDKRRSYSKDGTEYLE